jgi:hypothetical protein
MILDVLTCLADGRQIITQEEIPDVSVKHSNG